MKVKFIPQNVEFEIKPGQSVMHVAQDNGLYIKSVCKGVPSCAECRVRVVEGEHNVLPPATDELSLIGTGHFIDRRRLSCQLKCFGDITVDLNEQVAKQNGLIGKKTKRALVKDDRVEQSVAIRSEPASDDRTGQERREKSPSAPRPPARPPREPGAGGGPGKNPRPPRPPQAGPRPPQTAGAVRPDQTSQNAPNSAAGGGAGSEKGPRKRRRRRGGKGGGGGSGAGPSGSGGNSPGGGSGTQV